MGYLAQNLSITTVYAFLKTNWLHSVLYMELFATPKMCQIFNYVVISRKLKERGYQHNINLCILKYIHISEYIYI